MLFYNNKFLINKLWHKLKKKIKIYVKIEKKLLYKPLIQKLPKSCTVEIKKDGKHKTDWLLVINIIGKVFILLSRLLSLPSENIVKYMLWFKFFWYEVHVISLALTGVIWPRYQIPYIICYLILSLTFLFLIYVSSNLKVNSSTFYL